jgi:uroporphyrinogen-III decarboxylase
MPSGPPEAVEARARQAVEAGVQILAPECAVPLRTPMENLKALHRAVKSYC